MPSADAATSHPVHQSLLQGFKAKLVAQEVRFETYPPRSGVT
jgi:hypothetical protein